MDRGAKKSLGVLSLAVVVGFGLIINAAILASDYLTGHTYPTMYDVAFIAGQVINLAILGFCLKYATSRIGTSVIPTSIVYALVIFAIAFVGRSSAGNIAAAVVGFAAGLFYLFRIRKTSTS